MKKAIIFICIILSTVLLANEEITVGGYTLNSVDLFNTERGIAQRLFEIERPDGTKFYKRVILGGIMNSSSGDSRFAEGTINMRLLLGDNTIADSYKTVRLETNEMSGLVTRATMKSLSNGTSNLSQGMIQDVTEWEYEIASKLRKVQNFDTWTQNASSPFNEQNLDSGPGFMRDMTLDFLKSMNPGDFKYITLQDPLLDAHKNDVITTSDAILDMLKIQINEEVGQNSGVDTINGSQNIVDKNTKHNSFLDSIINEDIHGNNSQVFGV